MTWAQMIPSAHGAVRPMPANEPVLADCPFEPGYAGDEHQHDKQKVGSDETGEPAAGDEQAPRGR